MQLLPSLTVNSKTAAKRNYMITKDEVLKRMEVINIENKFLKYRNNMLNEIIEMYKEFNFEDVYRMTIQMIHLDDNKLKIEINEIDYTPKLDTFTVFEADSCEILWDAVSWDIAKREIKDNLYTRRKERKEAKKNKKSFFQKLFNI